VAESGSDSRRITLELSADLLVWLDALKSQMGFRSRGPLVEQLLRELLPQDQADEPNPAQADRVSSEGSIESGGGDESSGGLDEASAIVLISSGLVARKDWSRDQSETAEDALFGDWSADSTTARTAKAGIQLPGFVRRQAREVKRSLQESPQPAAQLSSLSLVSLAELNEALARGQQHWLEVYGQPPSDAVLDAALSWLARDIWPQSDYSDGRPFSWGLAQQVITSITPGWIPADPSLERVITAAGILEDPFGGSTLALRVPTLITRFVQRQRSRHKRTTSFEALDQSMTVHGALRLLQLPTIADRPYTLKEIREAYREQAQCHHPDAGGSADAMRRLNEAYQFLKDRYRRPA
jgi:hypothetical protein